MTTPDAVGAAAAQDVSSPRRSSVAYPLTVSTTEHVAEITAPENGQDAEEVHSCMTLSSTATSPGTSPVVAALPPLPQQRRVLLSSSSNERQYTLPATASHTEETAQPLSCSGSLPSIITAFTPPATTGETAAHAPPSVSPAPSKPPVGPSAAAATAMLTRYTRALSDAEKQDVKHEARGRPYMLLDSDCSGRSADCAAGTRAASTANEQQRRSLHATETRAPPPDGTVCDVEEAEEAAPAAPSAIIRPAAAERALSSEQRYAFHVAVKEHRSVFITGGAGTGKSHLLRTIIRALPASSTFVTATTGIAALNLSGSTLHSFVGCGIPDRNSKGDSLLSIVLSKQRCVRSWRTCRVLIIDEVSMLEPSFFDLVDYIARHVRNRPHEPFGGIQLILSGDFLQLPPVSRERRGSSPQFCFEAEAWWRVNPRVCLLSMPFRQRSLRFFAVLNEMRVGELQPDSVELLYSMDTTERVHFVRRTDVATGVTVEDDHGAPGVVRVGLKREADVSAEAAVRSAAACKTEMSATNMRQTRLELVNGFGRAMDAPFDGYTILRSTRAEVDAENERYYRQLNTEIFMYHGFHTGKGDFPDSTLTRIVHLRKGCRVMLIKNFDPRLGLVNGSTGTITDFVSFANGYLFKTQGISAADAQSICVGRGTMMDQWHTMLPIVAFDLRCADGTVATRELVVEPQEWKEMLGSREVSRSVQIPLILAYAITIHKSQGMSLTQVDIDFKKVFESGQSYVALSRCTDMASVRLHGFDAHRVSANPTALAYYKALALQQERLRWRRTHVPQMVAAEEAMEAFSCTPYGYVLLNEAETLVRHGREDRATGFSTSLDSFASTSTLSSRSPASDGDRLKSEDFDEGNGAAVKVVGKERRDGWGEGRTQRRRQKHHRHREGHAWAGDHSAGRSRAYARDGLDGESSDGSDEDDEDGDDMNETVRLDKLRRRITPLLTTAAMVKRLVTRQAMPLHHVRNSRIVVDAHALFQLVAGPESAAAFDVLFGQQDNMMRVPLCVHTLVTEAAAYRSCSESLSQPVSPHQPVDGSRSSHGDALVGYDTLRGGLGGARREPFDAPLLAASHAAAEALAVMERAKQDFILDVQRPEQTCALPAADLGWLRFTVVLPLLRHRQAKARAKDGAGVDAASDAGGTCREVDFILNRDPREILHHRAILEYAMYLQASFGEGVVICTDSVLLAAYAFAWRLRVASMDYLCGDNSGADDVAA
ncbi:putative PIF1 helicase-like protein [Leishmania major strain Friedlin]|uniref:ATP-dependent DNA helicase n=1 Tax=Leishmania major TaxID=5664 RepID=Q4QII5_LEIMA|nr:putative PIF1 helicase-like protein [Leishmania major strain Friedlin]CAG9569047.1 DNA_repair_and_recombination_helicase_protein_PIF7_-_putative [Leishmania major strain Friedlin]CAJ07068.1 putative PIF1 helicase-like protein [Leishmania major strain Friedlin]|eukprot:XP_001681013.1 putative PIF1 helicase-like protein [Leishmania major strain Friedlin]